MLSQNSFPTRFPLPSNHLPLTLISLEDWVLVIINGIDTIRYLQGQLTCDVNSLKTNHVSFAAHCDAKGKMLSCLYIFHYKEGMAFIERRSVRDNQITTLKKYAVFSKVNIISDDKEVLLGVTGLQAQTALSSSGLFTHLPNSMNPVLHYHNTTLLYFNLPIPRFLIITTPTLRDALQDKLEGKLHLNNSQQWLSLDIEAGYPIIDSANSARFIPQAVNMQALNGISFNKGCYVGQEAVARTKYRGTNKRAMHWLVGKAKNYPSIGDNLELKTGNKWRRTGTILASCQLEDKNIWVQAILDNNLSLNSLLRICDDDYSKLSLRSLPYDINK